MSDYKEIFQGRWPFCLQSQQVEVIAEGSQAGSPLQLVLHPYDACLLCLRHPPKLDHHSLHKDGQETQSFIIQEYHDMILNSIEPSYHEVGRGAYKVKVTR